MRIYLVTLRAELNRAQGRIRPLESLSTSNASLAENFSEYCFRFQRRLITQFDNRRKQLRVERLECLREAIVLAGSRGLYY